MPWVSPIVFVDGAPLNADDFYRWMMSMQNYFAQGIPGGDLRRNGQNQIVFDSDLDLGGHALYGAANVPTGFASVRNYGVQGQGAFDESDQFELALRKILAAGNQVAFVPAGRYLFSRRVAVPAGLSIWGSGAETIFLLQNSTDTGTPALVIQSKEGATIRDCAFQNVSGNANTGILVIQSEDVLVQDCYFGSGIAKGVSVTQSDRVTIDTMFCSSAKQAVDASSCNDLNVFAVSYWIPDGGTYPDVAIKISASSGVNVRGVFTRKAKHGVSMSDVQNGSIQGQFLQSLGSGVVMSGCRTTAIYSSVVWDSVVEGGRKEPGILLRSCDQCAVRNSVSAVASLGKAQFGVQVDGGTNNLVAGNILTPNYGLGDVLVSADAAGVRDSGQNTLEYGNFHHAVGAVEPDA